MNEMSSQHPIPWIYRIVLTYVEPFLAFGGVIQFYFFPQAYLNTATPRLAVQMNRSFDMLGDSIDTLFSQVVGGWLIITFNDLVTLRVFDRDVKVWKCVVAAHLISDLVYSWALYQDRREKTWDVGSYDFDEWLVMTTTIGPLLCKIAILLNIGIDSSAQGNSVLQQKVAGKNR